MRNFFPIIPLGYVLYRLVQTFRPPVAAIIDPSSRSAGAIATPENISLDGSSRAAGRRRIRAVDDNRMRPDVVVVVAAAFVRSRDGIAPAAQQEEEEPLDRTELDRSPEPQDTDLLFLDAFIGDPLVRSLVQVRSLIVYGLCG